MGCISVLRRKSMCRWSSAMCHVLSELHESKDVRAILGDAVRPEPLWYLNDLNSSKEEHHQTFAVVEPVRLCPTRLTRDRHTYNLTAF